ncbi:hypothetical protein AAHA92_25217 [Salvia divinorum]|uniref:Uncharacterized protein n=1 Tax=Salvia divinorum TaxID=28513 RepID=A0ABD1G9Z8_SALDI
MVCASTCVVVWLSLDAEVGDDGDSPTKEIESQLGKSNSWTKAIRQLGCWDQEHKSKDGDVVWRLKRPISLLVRGPISIPCNSALSLKIQNIFNQKRGLNKASQTAAIKKRTLFLIVFPGQVPVSLLTVSTTYELLHERI